MKPETLAIHEPAIRRDGAVAPPIHLSTTYEHGPANEPINDYIYVRHNNPNVSDFEVRITALEGGAAGVAFSSGMAAAAAVLMSLPAGARAIFHHDLYFDVKTLAREDLPRRGVEFEFVDFSDSEASAAALSRNADLVWIETPSNPKIEIIDIAATAELASAAGAKLIVDNTFATPALQDPFVLGADYVLHSATKYLGGHSDVQGGVIVVRDDMELAEQLRHFRTVTGGALAPFNAWLISRGLQTLYCRISQHCHNAGKVAEMLERHPAVSAVHYPWLERNAGHDIAQRQMKAGGGMVSFELKGGREAALKAAFNLKLFIVATSLGGVESLVEHRASLEGPESTTPDSLLRLSVGLEHADDLVADLAQALTGI